MTTIYEDQITLARQAGTISFADRLFDAISAECAIEEVLSPDIETPDIPCPYLAYISYDHYDRSLEIHCEAEAPEDWALSADSASLIFSLGFDRVWVNFANGTEQYAEPGRTGERKPVTHPRWTAETWIDRKRTSARILEGARRDTHDQVVADVRKKFEDWIAAIQQSRLTGGDEQNAICNVLTDVLNHIAPLQQSFSV